MLLQTRGRMTARNLAAELEVAERTIYRDLTALSAAGVPVYAVRGPGGGVTLVEEYRTTLTGLSPGEARALFMMSVPAPLTQLGVGQDFKTALLKLSASLPESRRMEESQARQRILLDSAWWFQSGKTYPACRLLSRRFGRTVFCACRCVGIFSTRNLNTPLNHSAWWQKPVSGTWCTGAAGTSR